MAAQEGAFNSKEDNVPPARGACVFLFRRDQGLNTPEGGEYR